MKHTEEIISNLEQFHEFVAGTEATVISRILPSGEQLYPFAAEIGSDVLAFHFDKERIQIRFSSRLVEDSLVLMIIAGEEFINEIERLTKDFNHFVHYQKNEGVVFSAVWSLTLPFQPESLEEYAGFIRNSVIMSSLLRKEVNEILHRMFAVSLN